MNETSFPLKSPPEKNIYIYYYTPRKKMCAEMSRRQQWGMDESTRVCKLAGSEN